MSGNKSRICENKTGGPGLRVARNFLPACNRRGGYLLRDVPNENSSIIGSAEFQYFQE